MNWKSKITKLNKQLQTAKDLIHHAADENERLKAELATAITRYTEAEGSFEGQMKIIDDQAKTIQELKAELAKHEWVSVEVRLPEVHEEIEVYNDSARLVVHAAMLLDGEFRSIEDQSVIRSVALWRYIHIPEKDGE